MANFGYISRLPHRSQKISYLTGLQLCASSMSMHKEIPLSKPDRSNNWCQKNCASLLLMLYFFIATGALLRVPCAYITHRYDFPSSATSYVWLWQVGNGTVRVDTLVLEEIALVTAFSGVGVVWWTWGRNDVRLQDAL